MAKIASDKRMMVVVWAAIACLLAILAFASFNAYGEEEMPAPSSSTTAVTSSTALTAASSSASGVSSGATKSLTSSSSGTAAASSSASSSSTASAQDETTKAETQGNFASADVEKALAHNPVPESLIMSGTDGVAPDTAGSAFTFVTPIKFTEIAGDLYWLGNNLGLSRSRIGNDLMAAAFHMDFSHSVIEGDIRIAGQSVSLSDTVVAGSVDVGALEVSIDGQSAATGYYCGAGNIHFEGAAKRFVAYGQSIYFDGVVDGDVTLSAQDIIIGPHAKISGLLDIRSGQSLSTLDIPATAQIGSIDTNLDHPNTIDQITQIRAAIAPYFQVGSMLFIVVSFVLLALAMLWGFGAKLNEANRLVRRYPLAVLVLGCIALMLAFVIIMLGTLLIFTIPLSLGVAFVLVAALIFCVPFTGASLALMLSNRIRPALCAIVGAALGAVLLFVPYVNTVVLAASLVYFVGYIVNISMFGHDEGHDASFPQRQADEDAPRGKARGILPVAAVVADAMHEFSDDEPAIEFNDESAISDVLERKAEGQADADSPATSGDAGEGAEQPAEAASDAEAGGEPVWSQEAEPTDSDSVQKEQ